MLNHVKHNITLPLVVILTLFLSACSSESSEDPSALDPADNQKTTSASVFSNIEGGGTLRFSDQQTCSESCTKEYKRNSQITITATPISGYRFSGWTGDCSGSTDTCALNLTGNKLVQATFVPLKYDLSLSNNGDGGISVSSNGQVCSRNCLMSFSEGKQVTLTAKASNGYSFAGWSGDACVGTEPCTINMYENLNITANYTQNSGGGNGGGQDIYYPLITEITNGQGGYIAKDNNGNCAGNCTEEKLAGSNISLTAFPYPGYEFDRWSGVCAGTTPQCNFTLNKAETAIATFKRIKHLATARVIGNGSIKVFDTTCKTTCSLPLDHGTQLTLEAIPAIGYQLKQWSGACSGSTSTCSITVTKALEARAEFIQTQHVLTTKIQGEGSISGTPVECNSASCSKSYDYGSQFTLTAKAKDGYEFAGWTGDCSGTGTCNVTMDRSYSVTANFTKEADTILTAKIVGSGTIKGLDEICKSGSCSNTYSKSTSVTLTATPNEGYEFAGWTGDCSGKNTCSVAMDQSRSVTANFIKQTEYILTAKVVGNGSITGLQQACITATCSGIYSKGTQVTLTASANTGYEFTGWSGDCSGIDSCTVTLDQSRSITANFNKVAGNILSANIVGSGTISGMKNACNAGTCTDTYDNNATVSLTATPSTGYEFAGWTGSCEGKNTCQVTMNQSHSVTANFIKETEYVLIAKIEGQGSITGLEKTCNSISCSSIYVKDTQVTLTASAAIGYEFTGWTGDCSGTSTCTVTLDKSRSVVANFNKVAGNILSANIVGGGTIEGLPNSCNTGTCTATYAQGENITLTAKPNTGYEFAGWTGDCDGNTACNITMDQSRSVTANFIKEAEYILIAKVEGQGEISGLKETCDSTSCSSIYAKATQVTLTASAKAGYTFIGWSGGSCTGISSCSITMDKAHTVTATFEVIKYNLTTQITGSGIVTIDGATCSQPSCTTQVNATTQAILKATPNAGYEFSGWSGDCSGLLDCSIKVSRNYNVKATFTKKIIAYTLTIPAIEGGGIDVNVNGDFKALCGIETCNLTLSENDNVVLIVKLDANYTVKQWTDSCSTLSNTETRCSINMTDNLQAGVQLTLVTHQATVSWDIPDTRENGKDLPLSEIGGYEIRYKRNDEDLFSSVIINESNQHETVIENLKSGQYQFKIASFDIEGIYSEYSAPIYKTF